MGIFSHLSDVATGRNEKRNKLLVNNLNFLTNRLYPNSQRRQGSSYACIWSDACVHTSYYFLDDLFLGKSNQEDDFITKPFRSKLHLIGPANMLELFKVLAIYLLVRNTRGENINEMFDAVGIALEEFIEKVFYYFDFHDEHKNIYKEFMSDGELEANRFTRLILNLFEQKAFGAQPTKDHLTIQAFKSYLHHFLMVPFDSILEKLYGEYRQ